MQQCQIETEQDRPVKDREPAGAWVLVVATITVDSIQITDVAVAGVADTADGVESKIKRAETTPKCLPRIQRVHSNNDRLKSLSVLR